MRTNNTFDIITDKRSIPYNATGTGSVTTKGQTVIGVGTKFTSEMPAASWLISLSGNESAKVFRVDSDTLAFIQDPFTVDLVPPSAQTSGVLVVGVTYTITTFVAGDDFINVGGTNVNGNVFVATGTTPTTWTNSSSLQASGVVPQIIKREIAQPKEIGLEILVGDPAGKLNNKTFSGSIIISKASNSRSESRDLIDPVIVDASGTSMRVNLIY